MDRSTLTTSNGNSLLFLLKGMTWYSDQVIFASLPAPTPKREALLVTYRSIKECGHSASVDYTKFAPIFKTTCTLCNILAYNHVSPKILQLKGRQKRAKASRMHAKHDEMRHPDGAVAITILCGRRVKSSPAPPHEAKRLADRLQGSPYVTPEAIALAILR
jgi:hypothetical protein